MKKFLLFFILTSLFATRSQAQLSLTKMIGKNSNQYRLGYDIFSFWDFPLNSENKCIRLELLDFAYYPGKTGGSAFSTPNGTAYLSIKLGYKYIFSETKTGFYLEPSAGYCKTMFMQEGQDPTNTNGIAGAVEGGYSLEIGQKGHTFTSA